MDEERKDLTYREYAIAEGISYEAVRKKIERNKSNPILKKILTKDGKKYLYDIMNIKKKRATFSSPKTLLSKKPIS